MVSEIGENATRALYSLVRYLAVASPGDNQWDQAIDEWVRRNPADVYGVALAWEEYAQSFQSQRGSLAGAAGALMLAHAAYASLMTGLTFEGPTWTNLIKSRAQQDPLIHAAHLLYELAHFRNVEQNVQAWDALPVKFLPEEPAPVAEHSAGDGRAVASPPVVSSVSSPSPLVRLAKKLNLDYRHIFTVPGNHDVRRAADKDRNIARLVKGLRAGSDDLDEVLANDEDRPQLGRRMTDYLAFAAQLAPASLGGDTSSLSAWSHRLDARGGLRVRLVGLNTALLAADDLDKGKLRLGTRALEHGLAMLPEDNEVIVVLSHHPLRDDWLADGRKADKWLQGRAHIHLFGHVHAPDLEETRGGSGQRLVRIAAGAVHGERKPEGVPAGHGYSLAALYAHQEKELLLRVWPRVWSDNNTGFRPDVHNIHEERGCAEHVIAGIKLTRPA